MARYGSLIDQARRPTPNTAAELIGWKPAHGVLSVYVDTDPADRGGAWRIAVRNGLAEVREHAAGNGDREQRRAVEETVKRLEQAVAGETFEPEGRGLIGFVEAALEPAEERWYVSQLPPERTEARHGARPQIGPMIEVLERGAPLGIVTVSAERIRLFHWSLGRLEELEDWELEVFSLDWRERKAPQPGDPASGQAVSAAGHDQYDQRLEANRERFAHQGGELARAKVGEREWRALLAFGDERYMRPFAKGFAQRCEFRHVDSADLVSQPPAQIERRVSELLPAVEEERQRALIERVKEATYAEARGAFGRQETLQALEQGRVEHLLYDCTGDHAEIERMIEMALATRAAITPVAPELGPELEEQEGVAALLRY